MEVVEERFLKTHDIFNSERLDLKEENQESISTSSSEMEDMKYQRTFVYDEEEMGHEDQRSLFLWENEMEHIEQKVNRFEEEEKDYQPLKKSLERKEKPKKLKKSDKEELHRESEKLIRSNIISLEPRKVERKTMTDFIQSFKKETHVDTKEKEVHEKRFSSSIHLPKHISKESMEVNVDTQGKENENNQDLLTLDLQEEELVIPVLTNHDIHRDDENKEERKANNPSEMTPLNDLLYPEENSAILRKKKEEKKLVLVNQLEKDLRSKYEKIGEIDLSEEEEDEVQNNRVGVFETGKKINQIIKGKMVNVNLRNFENSKFASISFGEAKISSRKLLELDNRRLLRAQMEEKRKNELENRKIDEEIEDGYDELKERSSSDIEEIESHDEEEDQEETNEDSEIDGEIEDEEDEEQEISSINSDNEVQKTLEDNALNAYLVKESFSDEQDDFFGREPSQIPFKSISTSQSNEPTQIASSIALKVNDTNRTLSGIKTNTSDQIFINMGKDVKNTQLSTYFLSNSNTKVDNEEFSLTQTQGPGSVFLDPNGLLVSKSSTKTYSRKDKASLYSQDTMLIFGPLSKSDDSAQPYEIETSENQNLPSDLMAMLSGNFVDENTLIQSNIQPEEENAQSLAKKNVARGFIDDEAEVETDTDLSEDEDEEGLDDLVDDGLLDDGVEEQLDDMQAVYAQKLLNDDKKDVEEILSNLQHGWRRTNRIGDRTNAFQINDEYDHRMHVNRRMSSRRQRFDEANKLTRFMSTVLEDNGDTLYDEHDKETMLDEEDLKFMAKRSEMRELKSTMSLSMPEDTFLCNVEITDHVEMKTHPLATELDNRFSISNITGRKRNSFANARQDQLDRLCSLQVSEKTNLHKRKVVFVRQSTPDKEKKYISNSKRSTPPSKFSTSMSSSPSTSFLHRPSSNNSAGATTTTRRSSVLFAALGQKSTSNKSCS